MARGIRVVCVNRGHDPRDFVLVAYGGAGPMHAASAGRLVDVGSVVIPPYPGAFSALGLVSADLRHELARLVGLPADLVTATELRALVRRVGNQLVLENVGRWAPESRAVPVCAHVA